MRRRPRLEDPSIYRYHWNKKEQIMAEEKPSEHAVDKTLDDKLSAWEARMQKRQQELEQEAKKKQPLKGLPGGKG